MARPATQAPKDQKKRPGRSRGAGRRVEVALRHRMDARDDVRARVDLVDLASVRAVIERARVAIAFAILVGHRIEVAGRPLADANAAAAEDGVEETADAAAPRVAAAAVDVAVAVAIAIVPAVAVGV